MKRPSFLHTSSLIIFSLFCFANTLFAASNPAPLINEPLVPGIAKPGSAAFTLTVNGTGFVAGATVNWNGSPRSTTVVSSSQITAAITAADVAKVGTAAITVVNPGPGGGSSNSATFLIRQPFSATPLAPDQKVFEPGAVAVGDFNGDGKTDLVIGAGCNSENCLGTLDFYPGNGDGTFGKPIRSFVPGSPPAFGVNLLVGDFNADGKQDLVFNSFDGDGNDAPSGAVMFGNGDGTFSAAGTGFGFFVNFEAVAAGDFTGDGLPGIVTTGTIAADGTPTTYVYLASPTFSYSISQSYYCQGGNGAAVGDFNGDGKLDLAMNSSSDVCGNDGVWVALGNGDGTFQNPVLYSTAPFGASNVVAADVNGDGKLDLITDGICVLLGNGDGTFSPGGCKQANSYNGNLFVADFNGDGNLDVALTTTANDSFAITIYFGNGKGEFANPVSYQISNDFSMGVGDFNGDGRLDFAFGNSSAGKATVFLQTVASVAPNSLTYATQLVGTNSPTQTITFTNDQASALSVGGIKIVGANSTEFTQTNNCGASVPAKGTCQIQVTFSPKTAGTKSASLTVPYQGTGGPQSVPLSGLATAVKLTPGTINFGDQKSGTTSPPQQATLTNAGATALSISSISIAGGNFTNFVETNNCGSSLAAGASCTITVTFTPNAKGQFSSGVYIQDGDPTSPDWVFLNGTGT